MSETWGIPTYKSGAQNHFFSSSSRNHNMNFSIAAYKTGQRR